MQHDSLQSEHSISAPNRFSLAKVNAKVQSVVADLEEMGEKPISLLVADQPYPFTYDGTSLTEDWSRF